MKRSQRQWGLRGFALTLELLLGMFLIVLAIMALFTLFPSSDAALANSDQRSQALHLARELMEQNLATPYDSLSPGTSQGTRDIQSTLRRGARPVHEFLYRVEIVQPDPVKEVKNVTIEVRWTRKDKESKVVLSGSKGRLW